MKGFKIFGDYIFEYLVITLMIILSSLTVIGFVPMFVGIVAYYNRRKDDRMFKDIFIAIKDNLKIIIKFTIIELIILIVSILNIYYFSAHQEGFNIVILWLSYFFLFIGIVFLAHAPMIIIGMNVNLRQLIFNCFLFFFGGLLNSIIAIAAVALIVILAAYIPYLIILYVYFAVRAVAYFTGKNFMVFKAKKLNISVYELQKKENEDVYFTELEGENLQK